MTTISDVLGGSKRTHTVRVPLNTATVDIDALIEAQNVADDRVTEALRNPAALTDEDLDALISDAEAAVTAVQDALTSFTFSPIGKLSWANLLAKYPATEEDRRIDPDTEISFEFQVAAVAASCADPEMTEDEARALRDHISDDSWDAIYTGAVVANRGGADAPFAVATGIVRRTRERSAGTRAAAASLGASSSDG